MRALSLSLLLLVLAGCATPRRDPVAEAQERAAGQAAKTRYWQIQDSQRQPRSP